MKRQCFRAKYRSKLVQVALEPALLGEFSVAPCYGKKQNSQCTASSTSRDVLTQEANSRTVTSWVGEARFRYPPDWRQLEPRRSG